MSRSEIALALRLEAQDYQDGFTLLYRRRRTKGRLAGLAVLPFCGLLLGAMVGDVPFGVWLFVLSALALLWLVTWGQRFFSGLQARRVLRNTASLRETLHYRFDAEGLTIAVGDLPAGGLSWRLIWGYSQDDKVLILYDSPLHIRVFPRRLVAPEDIAGIAAFAEAAGVSQR